MEPRPAFLPMSDRWPGRDTCRRVAARRLDPDSGVDATLYTLQRFLGRAAAEQTARRVGYPHTRFLDDGTWVVPGDSDVTAFPNLYRVDRTKIGLLLYPGVGEIELSSVADTSPRAFATDVLTIGAERGVIRTRHGLDLVPRYDLDSVPALDRMLIPGRADATVAAPVDRWAEARLGGPAERIHAGGGYPYELTFVDMARHETRLIARNAARWIEYPTEHLALGDRDWSSELLARPLILGLGGLALALGLRRRAAPGPARHDPARLGSA